MNVERKSHSGKVISILCGGKKVLVCHQCFEVVQKSLDKYQHFIMNDLDNHGMLKKKTAFIPHNLVDNIRDHNKKSNH